MTRPRPRTRLPRAAATALAATCLALLGATAAGCSSDSAHDVTVVPAALPACHSPEAPELPHAAGTLTQADTGAYCLHIGQTLDVFLTAPAAPGPLARWSRIAIADTSVLDYGNSGVMTTMVDVTGGVVVGAARGTTTLSSKLPDGKQWTATIVVS